MEMGVDTESPDALGLPSHSLDLGPGPVHDITLSNTSHT